MGNEFMRHGREVQLAQVDITEEALPLFPGFGCNVVGVALVLSFKPGGVFCHIDIDPLFVVVEEDAEGWFCHFFGLSGF